VNFTIERNVLRAALARVKPAVLRNSLPALVGVLIEATDDGVDLTATNLDIRIRTTVADAEVGEVGRVLVHHETLDRIVANSPTGPVSLQVVDGEMKVRAGRVKAQLRTLDDTAFPVAPALDSPKVATLAADWLAIQRVLHARSQDKTRPILTGVHLGDGTVETTDSFRMARHTVETDADFLFEPTCLVAAIRSCPTGPVTLRWQRNRFELEAGETVWSGSSIEGEFPPLARLIPTDTALSITANRAELMDAVKVVAAIGEETYTDSAGKPYSTSTVRLRLEEGGVVVQCRNADNGDAEVAIEATCEGELEVAFNAPYLLAMLGACAGDEVTLAGNDQLKPWKVVDGDLLQILMPVRMGKRAGQ
jgi:DNA polymerase-3 subunit beta